MTLQLSKSPIGLDGIPAAETVLSHVDGERGELIIAGERVGDLVRKTGFEGVTARLWSGGIGQPVGDAGVGRPAGAKPRRPNPAPSHAADTLSMMLGRKPDAREVAALDAYLVTVCDHGMNASTFTTRVVASTQADLFAAVTAGYCALTGPLHGGAPEPVLEMLDAIGTSERIKPWVDAALGRGERLMGFGHRIYRVRDPRADVLKAAIERLAGGGSGLPFAGEVEAYIRAALRREKPDRPLDTNVEFFTAILLDALRIPRQAFTPIFAVARAAGWTAHAREQQRGGRLIRPSSAYIGAMPD